MSLRGDSQTEALPLGEGGRALARSGEVRHNVANGVYLGKMVLSLFRHGCCRATFPKGEGFAPLLAMTQIIVKKGEGQAPSPLWILYQIKSLKSRLT